MFNDNVIKGAVMPAGFTGVWTPDPKIYGNLISPPINVSAANWPVGAPQTDAYPQFATDKGQQIGQIFFPYGSIVTTPGVVEAPQVLGNNWDQTNRYGSPFTYWMAFLSQVEAPDNWQAIQGQPLVPVPAVAAQNTALTSQKALITKQLASLQAGLTAVESALANLPN